MLIHTGAKSLEVSESNPFAVTIVSDGPSSGTVDTLSVGYTKVVTVTPSDSVTITDKPKGIFVQGATGALAIELWDGGSITLQAANGPIFPFIPSKVMSTGTTATGINLLY